MDDDGIDKTNGEDRDSAGKTAAEAMGIAPNLPRQRRRGADKSPAVGEPGMQDLRRQVGAAEEAIEKSRAEAKEANEKYVRLAAEMDNVRKRHRQDQVDRLQFATAEVLGKLLPIIDNFHRALEHAPEADRQLVEGLNLIVRQLEEVLESEGVVPIKAVGEKFDPALHQAVLAEPSDQHADEVVIDELQRGYMLHDRVLRPSLVKVARNN
jgi:molecular chaperone GrpE